MILEPAPAKLNLALHVRRRRADGYHDIETLFAFVTDGDELRVATGVARFAISGPFALALAGEGSNLVLKAERAFAKEFGIDATHRIELVKRLPIASGIGGGSADAAATLRALARLHGVAIDDPRLFALADTLGSDVPACLLGHTAIGLGRGEQLRPVAGPGHLPVLLVNPGVPVSTADVFRRWDGVDRGPIGDDPLAGRNDLEAPAREIAPVIGDVLDWLRAQPGAGFVRMSGSGATCFALFDSVEARAAAARAMHRGWWHLETMLA